MTRSATSASFDPNPQLPKAHPRDQNKQRDSYAPQKRLKTFNTFLASAAEAAQAKAAAVRRKSTIAALLTSSPSAALP